MLGSCFVKTSRDDWPPSSSTSSSKTIFTTLRRFEFLPDLLAFGLLLDRSYKVFGDFIVDVGFQQRKTDLSQRGVDVPFVSTPSPRRFFKVRFNLSESDSNITLGEVPCCKRKRK